MRYIIALILQVCIFFSGCLVKEKNEMKSNDAMKPNVQFEFICQVPWGSDNKHIRPCYFDYPPFGDVSPNQIRQMTKPVPFSIDSQKGIHIADMSNSTNEKIDIHHVNPLDNTIQTTSLSFPATHSVLDFLVDHNQSCYILYEKQENDSIEYTVSRYSSDGNTDWERPLTITGFMKETSEYRRLLFLHKNKLFIFSVVEKSILLCLHAETGEIENIRDLPKGIESIFIDERGGLYGTAFFENEDTRGIYELDPNRDNLNIIFRSANRSLFLYPIGIDKRKSIYVYKAPALFSDAGINRIRQNGSVVEKAFFNDLFFREGDSRIFTSRYAQNSVIISSYLQGESPKTITLDLPKETQNEARIYKKLVYVDDNDRFFIHIGEQPGESGRVLVFSRNGIMESKSFPARLYYEFDQLLSPWYYWVVDYEGDVYIELTNRKGVIIVKVHLSNVQM